MNTNYDTNNTVELKGTVLEIPTYSHTVLGEGFFESKIEVKRLSEENDILPITISERLCEAIKVGDIIGLRGQFRSYNRQEENHSRLMLTVFVRELVDPNLIANSNTIDLVGYICKEPIYRTTPFGREIADILLAVNRSYNKSDYIPCIAWGRNARFVKNLQVGDKLQINGRVQSRNYQKKIDTEIITKTAYEISISSIMICQKEEQTSFSMLGQTISGKQIVADI